MPKKSLFGTSREFGSNLIQNYATLYLMIHCKNFFWDIFAWWSSLGIQNKIYSILKEQLFFGSNEQFEAKVLWNCETFYLRICSKHFLGMVSHDGTYNYITIWFWRNFISPVIDRLALSNLDSRLALLGVASTHKTFSPGVLYGQVTFKNLVICVFGLATGIQFKLQINT